MKVGTFLMDLISAWETASLADDPLYDVLHICLYVLLKILNKHDHLDNGCV